MMSTIVIYFGETHANYLGSFAFIMLSNRKLKDKLKHHLTGKLFKKFPYEPKIFQNNFYNFFLIKYIFIILLGYLVLVLIK